MKEQWRCIPGIPEHYQVSNLGGVRTLAYVDRRGWNRKPRQLKPHDAEIQLRINGEVKWFAVAALILLAFVGPMPKNCRLARHLDDNRANNKVTNLAWGTDADNNLDARRNGRSFASYGHQGHRHSKKTKALLSKKSSRPHGRKMSAAHKAAITAGYRKRFPEVVQRIQKCACGCGALAKPGRKVLHGHSGGRKAHG